MAGLPKKALFDLPEGVIYLNGNSLGPLPKTVPDRVAQVIAAEWGQELIRGWNSAGWMAQPGRVGDKIGRLIGAPKGSVMAGDTLTIKVYQALASAIEMRPERRVILSDSGNFPTDLYMAQGLIDTLDRGHELKIAAPEALADTIGEDVAAVLVTEVDYRTGRRHDMADIAARANAAGAVLIWDLAHSVGAFPVDVAANGAEFAVGCTYKYLNAGPGAPAFIYVRPDLIDRIRPALSGWMGHDAPFAFDLGYRPAGDIERMRVGTPPVIQMSALEVALDVWDGVDMAAIRIASIRLSEIFIAETEHRCPELTIVSPRAPGLRGSQVALAHPEGYAIMQALISRGVIGDFRAPDILRFGFAPLYLDEDDVLTAVDILAEVMAGRLWDRPEFKTANRVT